MIPLILTLAPVLATSLAVSILIVMTKSLHGRHTLDSDTGVQKVHTSPTPRVGGIGVMAALLAAALTWPQAEARGILVLVLLASAPAFMIGLAEDLTKNVRPRTRLLSHVLSATILVLIGGYYLRHTGLAWTDPVMTFIPLAAAFSVLAVAGMTNAINIVDGFNGLASGTAMIILSGLAILGLKLDDPAFFMVCAILLAATGGFFLVNFPAGKLFLGDAGAYLLGFFIGSLMLILCVRHPGLSPWVPFLMGLYPVWEVLASIRRRLARGVSPGSPDAVHLHNLVSRSVARPLLARTGFPLNRNAATGAAMWAFPALCVLIMLVLEATTLSALVGIFVFHGFYDRLYRSSALSSARRRHDKTLD